MSYGGTEINFIMVAHRAHEHKSSLAAVWHAALYWRWWLWCLSDLYAERSRSICTRSMFVLVLKTGEAI